MADLTGQRLGPFEIRELLGTGGFATVYRAHDPRLRSDVALKILAENHSLDPTIRERFIGEAHALRRVESQSIIEVFDIGETPDARPYLVLEYADRGDLVQRRQSLANNGWRPKPNDAFAVVEALTDALDAIHSEMLVHRDVTPSNLLIRSSRRTVERAATAVIEPDERFMLSDMGLVKDLSQGSGLTVGGGTAGFWAPEQRDSLVSVDRRTDIYAASGLLVWFLTGASALTTTDWPHRLAMQGWPPSLMTTLQRGMSYSPDGRHENVRMWRDEVVTSLSQHALAEPLQPDVASTPTAMLAPPPPAPVSAPLVGETARPKKRLAAAIGALVVAAVLAVAAFFALRTGELNPTAVNRGDATIAVTAADADARITLIGPETIIVDDTGTYRFEATGVERVMFVDPRGDQWRTDELEVTAQGPGRGQVSLVAERSDGPSLRAEIEFEVLDG